MLGPNDYRQGIGLVLSCHPCSSPSSPRSACSRPVGSTPRHRAREYKPPVRQTKHLEGVGPEDHHGFVCTWPALLWCTDNPRLLVNVRWHAAQVSVTGTATTAPSAKMSDTAEAVSLQLICSAIFNIIKGFALTCLASKKEPPRQGACIRLCHPSDVIDGG